MEKKHIETVQSITFWIFLLGPLTLYCFSKATKNKIQNPRLEKKMEKLKRNYFIILIVHIIFTIIWWTIFVYYITKKEEPVKNPIKHTNGKMSKYF